MKCMLGCELAQPICCHKAHTRRGPERGLPGALGHRQLPLRPHHLQNPPACRAGSTTAQPTRRQWLVDIRIYVVWLADCNWHILLFRNLIGLGVTQVLHRASAGCRFAAFLRSVSAAVLPAKHEKIGRVQHGCRCACQCSSTLTLPPHVSTCRQSVLSHFCALHIFSNFVHTWQVSLQINSSNTRVVARSGLPTFLCMTPRSCPSRSC